MSKNRYGRIYHSDHHYNTLRFPSVDARREFAEKFEQHHAKYDHDGEVPRFEDTTASDANRVKVHDASDASIDGYSAYEIYAYHNRNDDRYVHYRPPTTIAPPVIVLKPQGEFIDSSTLTRHELSEIFMDMPDEDFQNLLKSVEENGFKDPIIRMVGEQVLDGWHRYSAAKKLNLLRKLRFKQWDEKEEGDPEAFVYARNMERRHLTPGQRAQIVVHFNERYEHGGDRGKVSNDTLKTQEDLAKEANVGVATIKRASQAEKTGRAKEIIAGEKSAGEVLMEQAKTEHTHAWSAVQSAFFDTSLDKHKRFSEFEDTYPGKKLYLFYELTVEAKGMRLNTFSHDFYFEVDGERGRDLTLAEIKAEAEFIQRIAKDIQFYQQGDDCHLGWLEKVLEMEPEQQETESEDSLSLDEKEQEKELYDEFMLKRVSKWKEKYASQGYSENELIQKATFDELIEAYYGYREANTAVVKKVIKKDNGEPTIDGISDLIEIMKSASFPYAMAVRALMRERHPELVVEPEPEQTEEDAPSLGEKTETLKLQIREYLPTWKQNNPDTVYATLFHLLDARFRIKHGIPRGRSPFFFDELEKLFPLMKANDLRLADKVRELLETDASGVKSAAVESEPSAEADEEVEQETTPLESVVEQLCEVLDTENSGIDDNGTLMEMLKKASVHYSFDLTHFLYITNMFDIDDVKKANAYCDGLAPPYIQSWKNTLLSMIRDIRNVDNWAKGYIAKPQSESDGTTKTLVERESDSTDTSWVRVAIEFGSGTDLGSRNLGGDNVQSRFESNASGVGQDLTSNQVYEVSNFTVSLLQELLAKLESVGVEVKS